MIYSGKNGDNMNILEDYDKAKQAIYDHVGLVEDWTVYPLDFKVGMPWTTDGDEVKYADSQEQFDSDGDYYSDEVYKQRFYKKHILRGEQYTLIFCQPHVDGMIFWRIFENSMER